VSNVYSATLCARRAACMNGTSRSTSSRGCLSATFVTSSSRRPSSCWSTRSATPSPPEGSSGLKTERARCLNEKNPGEYPELAGGAINPLWHGNSKEGTAECREKDYLQTALLPDKDDHTW
ncbi:hypothetical protein ILYODFUR_008585, partial [Ilyodon furcidens]